MSLERLKNIIFDLSPLGWLYWLGKAEVDFTDQLQAEKAAKELRVIIATAQALDQVNPASPSPN